MGANVKHPVEIGGHFYISISEDNHPVASELPDKKSGLEHYILPCSGCPDFAVALRQIISSKQADCGTSIAVLLEFLNYCLPRIALFHKYDSAQSLFLEQPRDRLSQLAIMAMDNEYFAHINRATALHNW